MTQQEASLLSLPDELIDHIFDFLAEPLQGPHPLVPVLSVCRRVYKIVKPLFYRDMVLGGYLGATSHIEAAIQRDSSLGQLVSNLELRNYGWFHLASDRDDHSREQYATLRAFTRLTGLVVAVVEPDEAASTLAALPSTSLQSLDLQLIWTEEPTYWRDLQTRLSRFSELRTLKCEDLELQTAIAENFPRRPRNSIQHFSLPSLLELHMADYIFLELIEGVGPLRQTLPRLQALHITITRFENAFAISACLSEAPSSLTKVSISLKTFNAKARQWLSAFPVVRSVEISRSLREPDLLAYIASATTLEIIKFNLYGGVTDRVLRALTGAGRPPRLRRIHLDHVAGSTTEEIAQKLAGYDADDLRIYANHIRRTRGPRWPDGGTAHGLQLALAAANANGIRVTGTALDCIGWHANFDRLLADRMMEGALKADWYDDVVARFGGDVAIAWLEEHAPEKIPLLRAHTSALKLNNAVP